ncbi:MAG: glycosyltransferase involved in cell wall biosynthesis [Alphaproteobacteria bacterium]|jgi:glycosyltransferase involved in cell wall biosynthesis
MSSLDVSIIVPIYNEEETLPHLLSRVAEVMRATDYKWELLCIDDGSTDDSGVIMEGLKKDYPEFKPLYQSRNYGQTAAMQAGFDHATGDVFVTMDGDLQNDPCDIPMMLEVMTAEGADIVSGWRKNRKDDGFRNFLSRTANKLVAKMTEVSLHDTGCSLKAYRREVMENMRIYGELHRFIPAVVSQFGAKVVEVEVTHHARAFGESKYGNMGRMFRVVLDLILLKFLLRYINRPMHAFGMTGLACLMPGGLILAYMTLIKLFGADIGQRPLLVAGVMLVLMGVQLIGMGVLGELLVRIYHEPEGRKQYVLRQKPRVNMKPKVVKKTAAQKTASVKKAVVKKPAVKKATPKKAVKKAPAKKAAVKKK